jgi:hypothetical protein
MRDRSHEFYLTALQRLANGVGFSFQRDNMTVDGVQWENPPDGFVPPTEQEVLDMVEVVKRQDSRKQEYPSIGDQLDALFHAGVFPPEMAAAIQAVKDKYPKGQA